MFFDVTLQRGHNSYVAFLYEKTEMAEIDLCESFSATVDVNYTPVSSPLSVGGILEKGLLTPVNTRFPLTSITKPYRRLKFTARVFWKLTADQVLVSFGSRAHILLTY